MPKKKAKPAMFAPAAEMARRRFAKMTAEERSEAARNAAAARWARVRAEKASSAA